MFFRLPALVIFCLSALPAQVLASLRINELVAANESGLVDDAGEYSDWIEIHNPGAAAVELAGWSLTDDAEQPAKWTFPPMSLGPGDYRVIFASARGQSESEIPHTSFKLDRDGEFLALTDPLGAVVSALTPGFPPLRGDESYGYDDAANTYRIWRSPSPGARNEEDPSLGPYLGKAQAGTGLAQENVDHVVSVQVLPNGIPIESVFLKQRVMQKVESIIVLKDDGQAPDETAGDGRYSGQIPASTLFGPRYRAGEMLRWAFHARDTAGNEARLPRLHDGSSTQAHYFGTIVEDPAIDSGLPVLHWFAEDPNGAVREGGSRASAFFEGQFYDNLFVRRRGQFGAIGWAKPKLKFDFNPRDHFRYDPARSRVEEFNLQSHFQDASFMRENLAFAFFNEIGTPAPDTRHWHIRLDGSFFGLFSFVEQVDEDFLRQQGLDPEGALYKANGFPSTLAKVVTPALYQKETRKDESYADLIAFADGINSPQRFVYIMDHVNLPAMVNEMAGQSLIRNADRLTKNYYVYRDPRTDLWQRFPWDMDGAFSTSAGLATENFASPLYGDTQHTQAPGQPIYQNFLLDAILDHKPTRQMYLRRLRTFIDAYLADEATYFRSSIDARLDQIRPDARADALAWSTGDVDAGARTIKDTALALRRRELLETFGKDLVPDRQSTGLTVTIGTVDPAPGDSSGEYFELINPHDEAVDISQWTVSGAVSFAFPPGTVIPRKGTLFSPDDGILYVVRDVRGFRNRSTGPRGGQGRFFVGSYAGKLSSRGETIAIRDATGRLLVEHTYPATGTTYAAWAQEHFSEGALEDASVSGWAAEHPGTGVSNLHRYAFGIDAAVRFELPATFTYHRVASASDLRFFIESSRDLIDWRDLGMAEEQIGVAADGYEAASVSLTESQDNYYRVRVELSAAD